MRPIKFRVWNKFNKKMLNAISIDLIDSVVAFPDKTIGGRPSTFAGNIKDYPIMQFTGLLDKNGVEIYEGDIIKGIYAHFVPEEIAVIYWDKKEAGFIAHWQDDDSRMGISEFFKKIEIMGNIYEHPHLISSGLGGK